MDKGDKRPFVRCCIKNEFGLVIKLARKTGKEKKRKEIS